LLQDLGPDAVEGADEATSNAEKARCWERFREHHQRLAEEGGEGFYRRFTRALQRAYDQQIQSFRR